jgi:hypothetical protein
MGRFQIDMYGQLTEINLRQKYFRKRIEGSFGYSRNTYEKCNRLEFQVGRYSRKCWMDRGEKSLEDYYTWLKNRGFKILDFNY